MSSEESCRHLLAASGTVDAEQRRSLRTKGFSDSALKPSAGNSRALIQMWKEGKRQRGEKINA